MPLQLLDCKHLSLTMSDTIWLRRFLSDARMLHMHRPPSTALAMDRNEFKHHGTLLADRHANAVEPADICILTGIPLAVISDGP